MKIKLLLLTGTLLLAACSAESQPSKQMPAPTTNPYYSRTDTTPLRCATALGA